MKLKIIFFILFKCNIFSENFIIANKCDIIFDNAENFTFNDQKYQYREDFNVDIILLNIKNFKDGDKIFELEEEIGDNHIFYISGKDEKNNHYEFSNKDNKLKNKKFLIIIDLNEENIKIREITSETPKKTYSDNIFVYDIKRFTNMIIKLTQRVEKLEKGTKTTVDEDKYIFCNNCNGSFLSKIKSNNYIFWHILHYMPSCYKCKILYISKNTSHLENLSHIFWNNKLIEEVDFGNFNYNVKNIMYMFDGCKNLKKVYNFKNLFNENLNDVSSCFGNCKNLKKFDISGLKLPKECYGMFANSGIEELNYTDVDCSMQPVLALFFFNTNIKEFDFTKLKNTNNIASMSSMFSHCYMLKQVKFPDNTITITEDTGLSYIFDDCKNLKNIDLKNFKYTQGKCTIYGDALSYEYVDNLILPDDTVLTKTIIKNIKDKYMNKETNHNLNLIYKGIKLEKINKYDDLESFINNPEDYINNGKREQTINFNKNLQLKQSQITNNITNGTQNVNLLCGKCCCQRCC